MHDEGIKCSLGTKMLQAHSQRYFFRQILSQWLKFIRNHTKKSVGGTSYSMIISPGFVVFSVFHAVKESVSKKVC